MIEVRYDRGLYLPEVDLWLDARRSKPRGFVSHAHADHYASHEQIFCSVPTGRLLHRRFRAKQQCIREITWGAEIDQFGTIMRVLPAGHITGSAMLHLTRKEDGATLLYTGDTKGHGGRTCEPAEWRHADTLIIETTYGLPKYQFPPIGEVEARVLEFVRSAMHEGRTPVLLGYPLGKAQEAIALLSEHHLPVKVDATVRAMTVACRKLGVALPDCPAIGANHGEPGSYVIVASPHALRSTSLRCLPKRRVAMLSGWGLEPGARFRYGVDEVIPWSDHADHAGLWDCIRRVQPKRVITVHGYAREFAMELRRHGIDAWSALGGDQLELTGLWSAP